MKKQSFSPEDTYAIALALGKEAFSRTPEGQVAVFTLQGELGAGKTTFAQGFAAGLGVKEKVLSPTFVIMKSYGIPSSKKTFYHIDCYRLKSEADLLALGWEEIATNPGNIILLEWPERVFGILPAAKTSVVFESMGKEQREIIISQP